MEGEDGEDFDDDGDGVMFFLRFLLGFRFLLLLLLLLEVVLLLVGESILLVLVFVLVESIVDADEGCCAIDRDCSSRILLGEDEFEIEQEASVAAVVFAVVGALRLRERVIAMVTIMFYVDIDQ